MKSLRIVGVPEHFNLPWHLAIDDGEFLSENIDLKWADIPEGTGKMCAMLRDGSADMAVILTEGIVKDIAAGNPSKIVQVYVESPLIWGIHVAANSNYNSLSELQNKTAAISRFGSGSHLMACVNADQQGWDPATIPFEVVNTIDGAVDALSQGKADYFMWERFMTKPLVDRGVFRRIADCPTPWPCFVIVVRDEILESDPEAIRKILKIINRKTSQFKNIPGIDRLLATRFNQRPEDIADWLSLTKWSAMFPTEAMLNKVQKQLFDLSLIDKMGTFADMAKAI